MLRLFIAVLLCLSCSVAHAVVLEDLVKNGEVTQMLSDKKVCYYISSFDPLHLGHETVVKQILDQNLCDYVLIYPAWYGYENNKPEHLSSIDIRLDMLFTVFANHPKVIVTRLGSKNLQEILMKDDQRLIAKKPTCKSKIEGTKYIGVIDHFEVLLPLIKSDERSVFMRGIKISESSENLQNYMMSIPAESFIIVHPLSRFHHSYQTLDERKVIKRIYVGYPNFPIKKLLTSLFKAGVEPQAIDGFLSAEVMKIVTKHNLYQEF